MIKYRSGTHLTRSWVDSGKLLCIDEYAVGVSAVFDFVFKLQGLLKGLGP